MFHCKAIEAKDLFAILPPIMAQILDNNRAVILLINSNHTFLFGFVNFIYLFFPFGFDILEQLIYEENVLFQVKI